MGSIAAMSADEAAKLHSTARRVLEYAARAKHPAVRGAYRSAATVLLNAAELVEKELAAEEEGRP